MIVQRHTGFKEIPQFLPAGPSAGTAPMGSEGDMVEVAADGGELAGGLPESAELRLRQWGQGAQVSPQQVGDIGRRCQAASSRTSLQQLAVAHREPDVNACLS